MKRLIFKNYKVSNMRLMKEIENIELIYKDQQESFNVILMELIKQILSFKKRKIVYKSIFMPIILNYQRKFNATKIEKKKQLKKDQKNKKFKKLLKKSLKKNLMSFKQN